MERISRQSALFLAGAAMMCYPVWGAATLTVTGVNFNINGFVTNYGTTVANGLASQTGTLANCTIATPRGNRMVGPCSDTAFVVHGNMVATSSSTFASPRTFNGMAPTNQTFMTAFRNATTPTSPLFQPTLRGWTIRNGGTLDVAIDAKFTVVPLVVPPNPPPETIGGMWLAASIDRYTRVGNQPTMDQLVWTQALYINYGPGSMTTPANTLDDYAVNSSFGANTAAPFRLPAMPLPVPPGGTPAGQYTNIPPNAPRPMNQMAYADPIYGGQLSPGQQPFNGITFQSAAGISQFVDLPGFFYSVPTSFRAIALLTAVNTSTRVLTVFDDGVSYGFDLTRPAPTPEPSLRIFSLLLLALLFVAHRRRGKSNQAS
jgi:hypothetical protein